MENSYTQFLENEMWQIADEWDDTEDYSLAISFLNSADSFRSFGEGLLFVMAQKYPAEYLDIENAAAFLVKLCENGGIDSKEIASSSTLTNWFRKGMRPKKGEASRRAMFAFAFALKLSVDETGTLFHSVYLDRAFNYRNEDEVIYYYCLKSSKGWSAARKLIDSVQATIMTQTDATMYTTVIKADIDGLADEKELISYINSHGHNFEKNSVAATEAFVRLLSDAKSLAAEDIALPENQGNFKGKWTHGNEVSGNLLYEVITGASVTGRRGTRTVFHNTNLPKEIKNRFPEALTFSKKDMSFEERRKAIILLFSYAAWYKMQWTHADYDFDDYITQLDSLLFDCNYMGLYFGNPFDWLFLYCAQAQRPLDMLRDTLQEVFE